MISCECKSEEITPFLRLNLNVHPVLLVVLPASNRTTPRSKLPRVIDDNLHECALLLLLPVLLSVRGLSLERIVHLIERHTISYYDHLVLPTGALSAVGRSGGWVLLRAG
jgi:hypothetical protein